MEQRMKHACDEQLTDKEFGDEILMQYTDPVRKRYLAEHNMITKLRSSFKKGDSYGETILETIFPKEEYCSREEMVRHRIETERTMKVLEEKLETLLKSLQILTKEKEESLEEYYDCQAELIQQKEYVTILQAEETYRKERRLAQSTQLKQYLQHTEDDLEGIERSLKALTPSPYSVFETVNSLIERKGILLKQKQTYQDLLVFLE